MNVINTDKAAPYPPPLLGPEEPLPYTIYNPDGRARAVIICEHASNYIPAKLDNLGLDDEALRLHMAWDIGAARVARRLSELLEAPAILANYSRLVIDINRRIDHPTAFVTSCEGRTVPGNATMGEEDRARRIAEIYEPFHARLAALIESFTARGVVPAIFSIHSFTPVFYGQSRPWEIGVLWAQDSRLPLPVLEYFRQKGYVVGDNEPYDARILRGSTVGRHADTLRLPNVLVEIRNDLIGGDEQGDAWAEMLGDCFKNLLRDETIHSYYDGPIAPYDQERERHYFEEIINMAKRGNQDG